MKRRVKESDAYGGSFKSFIKSLEVALLIRKNLSKSGFSLFYCVGADDLAESWDYVRLEEDVLCKGEKDEL